MFRIAAGFRAILPVTAALVPLVAGGQGAATDAVTEPGLFLVDGNASWVRVLVYRGGVLRGFGHNHVVSHHRVSGTVALGADPAAATLTLELAVADLVVDDPQQRALAGADFAGRVTDDDIAGTRANLLGKKLLQAAQYPQILIRSDAVSGTLPDLVVTATVIVKGAEHAVTFPAIVELSGDALLARGEREISHRELGLKPFKAALGTLRVRDELYLQYEISALRSHGVE